MSLLDSCYIGFLNLDHRTDRLEHMTKELERVGIKAERTRGKKPNEYDLSDPKFQVMKNRTAGAIGCHMGQVEIMKKALELGKHAFVMEDDLVFCSDFQERIKDAEQFLSTRDWQILWGGGTYHVNPAWWHKKGHSSDLPQCECTLGVDAELTDNKKFVRTYGTFSTHGYIVHKDFIDPLLVFLDANVHLSMGIDWLMILLQPQINTFAPVPGMIKQLDNQSDIGNGITRFSGFSMLGEHWFQDKAEKFNYENFKI